MFVCVISGLSSNKIGNIHKVRVAYLSRDLESLVEFHQNPDLLNQILTIIFQ